MDIAAQFHLGPANSPQALRLFNCRNRVSVIVGPLGSGKTYTVVQRILFQMCEQEPNAQGLRLSRWLAIRNTYSDLAGTTIKDFRAVFAPEGGVQLGDMRMGGLEPPTMHIDFGLPDDTRVRAEMIFLALDREDSVRKLRGYQLTGVWLNEMKELQQGVVSMADGRIGRYPSMADGGVRPTWFGMIGDTNAYDEDHWLREVEKTYPENWSFFWQPGGVVRKRGRDGLPVKDELGRQVWLANPRAENIENLVADYYPAQLSGKKESFVACNLANELVFHVDGKPIYPEYQDHVHFSPHVEYIPGQPIIIGLDFGRTPAATFWHLLKPLDRWVCFDELVATDMSASLFAPELKRHYDQHYKTSPVMAYGDPSGDSDGQTVETTPIDLINAAGIPCVPAHTNVYALRHKALSAPLLRLCMDGRPALLIGPKARLFRKAMQGGYQYRRLKIAGADRYTDTPDKNGYSHPAESGQYAVLGGGEGHAALMPQVEQVNYAGRPIKTWDTAEM